MHCPLPFPQSSLLLQRVFIPKHVPKTSAAAARPITAPAQTPVLHSVENIQLRPVCPCGPARPWNPSVARNTALRVKYQILAKTRPCTTATVRRFPPFGRVKRTPGVKATNSAARERLTRSISNRCPIKLLARQPVRQAPCSRAISIGKMK